jgi:hypothetical protein
MTFLPGLGEFGDMVLVLTPPWQAATAIEGLHNAVGADEIQGSVATQRFEGRWTTIWLPSSSQQVPARRNSAMPTHELNDEALVNELKPFLTGRVAELVEILRPLEGPTSPRTEVRFEEGSIPQAADFSIEVRDCMDRRRHDGARMAVSSTFRSPSHL